MMEDLIQRFCPPLDPTVVLSIAGDYEIDKEESLNELFNILESLKLDAELIEAAADIQDISIKASSKSAITKSTASESLEDGGQSETDSSSVAPLDGFSPAELKVRLRDMFPTCTVSEIERVLAQNVSASDAMDELLNFVFFKETPEIEHESRQSAALGSETNDLNNPSSNQRNLGLPGFPKEGLLKGVDGFAVDEDHIASRKAKARRKKQNKNSQSSWSQSESSLASDNPSTPTMHLQKPMNAWSQMKDDVDFLAENLDIPRSILLHMYHSNRASAPKTVLVLVQEQLHKNKELKDPDEKIDNIALQLKAIVPELDYSYIVSLCQISKESGWSATQLIMLLAEGYEESLQFTAAPISGRKDVITAASSRPEAIKAPNRGAITEPQEDTFDLEEIEREYTFNIYKAADAGSTAHSYWRRGHSDKRLLAAATHYSEERKTAIAKIQQLASQRAEALAEQQSGPDWIDLHGIKSSDAKRIVTKKLQKYWKDLEASSERARGPLRGYYRIVTGKGLHSSTGRGVLGPTISRMLVKDGWKIAVFDGELAVTGRN